MKIIVITGQTATGKTKLALSKKGVLINSDARQVYEHLDIITGKDRPKIKDQRSKIFLYDIIDPKEYFSSFDYQKIAIPLIKKIIKEKKMPIVVGGTYLYLSHLLYKVDTENIPPNWKLRKELGNKSVLELQKILAHLNPQFFNLPEGEAGRLNQSDKNNPQRLIRKIEIAQSGLLHRSATSKKEFCLEKKLNIPNIKIEFIGLKFKQKTDLVKAIKRRVNQRLEQGAIKEVKDLLKRGYKEFDPGLKTIGYKQIIQYLKGKLTEREAINQWITKELQYAKRQYTFMKKDPNISWRLV